VRGTQIKIKKAADLPIHSGGGRMIKKRTNHMGHKSGYWEGSVYVVKGSTTESCLEKKKKN